MMRWWDSPEQAVEILKSVDSTDAVQGVGTAVLGYHALSQSALKPLSRRTLVDVNSLLTAVDSIDLSLVSKAVSESVRPVLDDAADAYGELFVQDLHWRAKDSLERLVLSWTASGMPWPNAIERAAEVYGVPIEKLGKYSAQMKSPVTPMVRQDIADRVLMSYASEKGNLEGQEISKRLQGAELAEFNNERRRDENGRFATTGGGKRLSPEERKIRRERRNKRNARNQRLAAAKTASREAKEKRAIVDSSRKQVEDLLSIFERPKLERQKLERMKLDRPKVERQKADRPKLAPVAPQKAAAPKVASAKPAEQKTAPKVDLARKYEGAYREQQEGYIAVSVEDYKRMRETGKMPVPNAVLSPSQLNTVIDNSLLNPSAAAQLRKTVFLRVSDFPVIDGGLDTPDGAIMPKEAELNFKGNGKVQTVLYEDLANIQREWGSHQIPVNVVDVNVGNADDFFSKALQGAELAEFNRERRRDEDGKFASSGAGPRLSRRERRERRMRRQRRLERKNAQRVRLDSNPAKDLEAEILLLNNLVSRQSIERQKADRPKLVRQKVERAKIARLKAVVEEKRVDAQDSQQKTEVPQEVLLKPKQKFKHEVLNQFGNQKAVRQTLSKKMFVAREDDFTAMVGGVPGDFVDQPKTTVNPLLWDGLVTRKRFNQNTRTSLLGNFMYDFTELHKVSDTDRDFFTDENVALESVLQDGKANSERTVATVDVKFIDDDGVDVAVYSAAKFEYPKSADSVVVVFDDEKAERAFRSGRQEFVVKVDKVDLKTYMKMSGANETDLSLLDRYREIPTEFTIATITAK